MDRVKKTAIVLSAGSGKRMGSSIPKQYLLMGEKPVLYYSLKAFEESSVDEIILVAGRNDLAYCRENLVDAYSFKKVTSIIEGGTERYHSVYEGLKAIKDTDYVLIHDGARPLLTVETIEKTLEEVIRYKACVVGVPSKDTVKLVGYDGIVLETPQRDKVWCIQTPQAFSYKLIMEAYDKIMVEMPSNITDDAMVLESALHYPVRMVMGSYSNIKITTPDDIIIGEALLKNRPE